MHHSQNTPENQELLRQVSKFYQEEAEDLNLGPTGLFPEGKLDETDEGEIRIAVTTHANKVVLSFGKAIEWLAFTPEQAEQVGYMLIEKATKAKE